MGERPSRSRSALPGSDLPRSDLPGRADPEAVDVACDVLAPLGDDVERGGGLGVRTTYRVGGRAAVLVTVRRASDLALVGRAARTAGLPVLALGRGSNLLVADGGFAGVVVILDTLVFGAISIDGSAVRAGGAVPLPVLARQSVDAGLTGLEWAVGVPGSVGGAVRMNAGGHGSDVAHCLESCQVVDLGRAAPAGGRTMGRSDLAYGYRRSALVDGEVVVEAEFRLEPGDVETGRATIRDIVRWRREHQPGGQNAGSIFTNPPGGRPGPSAGWLIEAAGCKGRRSGSAMVSPKHANFFQADEDGSADDVRALIEEVRSEVARTQGVRLHTEVRMLGFPDSQPLLEDHND